jgi:hypothetical protein
MISFDDFPETGNNTWLTGRERWCTASFFIVRRKALPEGFYDENYDILGGYDDWDFFHRMRHLNGWRTAYTTKACYQHGDSVTQRLLDKGGREEAVKKSREYFKKKFGRYAEDIWTEKYPDQMNQPYRAMFDNL